MPSAVPPPACYSVLPECGRLLVKIVPDLLRPAWAEELMHVQGGLSGQEAGLEGLAEQLSAVPVNAQMALFGGPQDTEQVSSLHVAQRVSAG